jgi:hypothetical protein
VIIDQIHELILEHHQISTKSITGHLMWAGWVHHSWRFGHAESLREVGPEMPECRSKRSTLPVVWSKFGFFRCDPNDFLSRLVTMDETWLCHYDKETKQQSIEWWHRDSPRPPKNSECKNPLEKFSPRIFGIKKASSSLIILQRAKLSTRSITHFCWCKWRTFWRKTLTGRSQSASCSCTTMPWLTGHLQPRRNWPIYDSSVLITHPILRIWPRPTITCSLDWENNWKFAIFRPTRMSLSAALTWLDGQNSEIFLSGLQKLRATG